MGRLIPYGELWPQRIDERIKAATEAAVKIASGEIPLAKEQLIVRDALPHTDFGLTNEYWVTPTLTANAWADYITQELPKKRFALFLGVYNQSANPQAVKVKFALGPGAGTKVLDIVDLEPIYMNAEVPVGFLEEPILYKGGQTINIDVYSKANVAEPLGFRVAVIEPSGEVIV